MCGLFSILRETDQAKVSSTNFRETLLPAASFVCCQLDMKLNGQFEVVFSRDRENVNSKLAAIQEEFVRFLNEHFRAVYDASDFM